MNGAALFDIYEKFGSKGSVVDLIRGNGKKSFQHTCWMLAKFAEQGELVRRYQGFDHGKFPSAEYFQTMLRPLDVVQAKDTLERTIRLGFSREEEREAEEIDLGLQELEKKTEVR